MATLWSFYEKNMLTTPGHMTRYAMEILTQTKLGDTHHSWEINSPMWAILCPNKWGIPVYHTWFVYFWEKNMLTMPPHGILHHGKHWLKQRWEIPTIPRKVSKRCYMGGESSSYTKETSCLALTGFKVGKIQWHNNPEKHATSEIILTSSLHFKIFSWIDLAAWCISVSSKQCSKVPQVLHSL